MCIVIYLNNSLARSVNSSKQTLVQPSRRFTGDQYIQALVKFEAFAMNILLSPTHTLGAQQYHFYICRLILKKDTSPDLQIIMFSILRGRKHKDIMPIVQL